MLYIMENNPTQSNSSTLRNNLNKIEKICAALFIITDSIEHNDLVKLRVREICLDILSFMNSMDLDGELSPLVARQMAPVKCFIDEICSILNVSRMSGLISEMNYQILNKELELFCINLDGNQVLSSLLQDDPLAGPGPANGLEGSRQKVLGEALTKHGEGVALNRRFDSLGSNGQLCDDSRLDSRKFASTDNSIGHKVKDKGLRIKDTFSRRSVILKFIREKGQVTIKDICKIRDKTIVSCSEKTIQRELMSLIKEGVVKREGDKRWTKYSLKDKRF